MAEPLSCPHCSQLLTDSQLKTLMGRYSNAQRKTRGGGQKGGRKPLTDIEKGEPVPANVVLYGKDVFYGIAGDCRWDGTRRDDSGNPRLIFDNLRGDDYYIQYWRLKGARKPREAPYTVPENLVYEPHYESKEEFDLLVSEAVQPTAEERGRYYCFAAVDRAIAAMEFRDGKLCVTLADGTERAYNEHGEEVNPEPIRETVLVPLEEI